MVELYNLIGRYRRHIKSVSISPMGKYFGKPINWNLRVSIETKNIRPIFNLLGKQELTFWEKKLNRLVNEFYDISHWFKGNSGWKCKNELEYLTTTETLYNFLNYLCSDRIEIHLYYQDDEPLKKYQNTSLSDEYFWNEIEKYRKTEKGNVDREIAEYEQQLKKKFRNFENMQWRTNEFLERCDKAYNRQIIGKIRAETALTANEIEKYEIFKDAYKQLIKIKSFTRQSTKIIKNK